MANKKIILAIILLATILRLYKLDSYPVSLSWDEVAIGYNAFAIAQTGTDEYGNKWPLLFKSFNDYKLPGYIYLDAIFIKFLGLSEFSTRLPSALSGLFAVILMYLLTKEMFKNLNWRLKIRDLKLEIQDFSAFMLAISPWHLHFSRAAFEANLSLTFILGGVLLLFYGLKNKFAAVFALPVLFLSLYFYYFPRVFTPLILIAFLFIYLKQIAKNLKFYAISFFVAVIITIPINIQIFSPQGLKRVREVSIFEDKSQITDYVNARASTQAPLTSFFLNRRIPLVYESLHNYFSHFSFGFLFFGDDPNPRHRSAFHGNLYLIEIPLLLLGFWVLLKYKDLKIKYFLLTWFLLSPIPAALTKETPHGLRALLMLPPIIILNSLAISSIIKKKVHLIIFTLVLIFFFTNYLYSYYILYPLRDNLSWAYGYKQMIAKVTNLQNQFDRIIITGHYWKPYIFYLFYNKISPDLYRTTSNQESIGKIRFGTTAWDSGGKNLDKESIDSLKGTKTLIIISPTEYEAIKQNDEFKPISTVRDYSNTTDLFLIGEWR